ncbi:MAG: hypothetical protein WCH46_03635 [bacterium]
MKTRTSTLPLVILLSLFYGNNVLAQQIAHTRLLPFYTRIPTPPAFPDNSVLQTSDPQLYEDQSDLVALQKQLTNSIRTEVSGAKLQTKVPDEASKGVATSILTLRDETPQMQQAHDNLFAALKAMQKLKVEYDQNFVRLEEVYKRRIHAVESPSATATISATRDKVLSEQYLLTIYRGRVADYFKIVDTILEENDYGSAAKSHEVQNLFRGAQQDEALLVHDIIERLRLERIAISNCARLSQLAVK